MKIWIDVFQLRQIIDVVLVINIAGYSNLSKHAFCKTWQLVRHAQSRVIVSGLLRIRASIRSANRGVDTIVTMRNEKIPLPLILFEQAV
ncbi:hypothetical protein WT08_00150 [Burkholderia sp. MSMB1552]|nr:hypothetical protein WT08_00150 [Burkholderia sp. MSMB1552]KWZ50462.1 hypothetical protein WS92_24020 [Burkholderia sp. MSMB1588]